MSAPDGLAVHQHHTADGSADCHVGACDVYQIQLRARDALAEPEPFTVTRHRCLYCRRSWQNKARALEHMQKCWYNRGCKTCAHADLLGGAYVNGCELGENLNTSPDAADVVVPRSQCPLWEATKA